jgi:hypothetical protein
MKTPIKFDKWDYKLILIAKRYIDDTDGNYARLIGLWVERNEVGASYISPAFVVGRASEIIDYLFETTGYSKYSPLSILEQSSPYYNWMYPEIQNKDNNILAYWERLMYVYASILRHTEIKHIPGLDEYFNNVWLKEGNP